MKIWLRRLAFLIILFVWVIILTIPLISILLAFRGEIQIGRNENNHVRLFLIQEKDFEGVGLESLKSEGKNRNCSQTTVNYWLWLGDDDNLDTQYCTCTNETGLNLTLSGACNGG